MCIRDRLVDVEDKALRTVSFVHALCVIRRGYRVEYPPFHQHLSLIHIF